MGDREPAGTAGGSQPVVGAVLVAEDHEPSRELFRLFVAKLRLANPVVLVGDGEEAIAYLARAEKGEVAWPALVVVDLHMPGAGGRDVLRWCRERPAFAAVPAVVLTGSAEGSEIDECRALGATSYLAKPLSLRALEDMLRGLPVPWALVAMR